MREVLDVSLTIIPDSCWSSNDTDTEDSSIHLYKPPVKQVNGEIEQITIC